MVTSIFRFILSFAFCLSLQTAFSQNVALVVEPNHSYLGFGVSIADGFTKVKGSFTEYTIDIDYQNQDITQSTIKLLIDVNSIHTGISDRDEHLKSADFFDAEKFPNISFESREILQDSITGNYWAIGDFYMHGVKKVLRIPFKMTKVDGNTLGFEILTLINRMDFDLGADFKHTAIDNFLAEKIEVEIYFWTKKKKAKKKE